MVKDLKECGGCCRIIGTIAAVLLVVLVGYYVVSTVEKAKQIGYIGGGINNNVINVSKQGIVYATPNLAQISFSVITEEKEVGDAIKENSEKSSAVIEILKAQGVSETDIKTTYFNVYPLYEWRKADGTTDIYSTGTRVLVGYEATETIEVKVRDVEKIGSLIEGAVGAGANQVSSLQFVVENEEAFKAQARAKAITDARAEAIQTAQALGVKLGKIVSFSESSTPYYAYKSAIGMGGGSPEAADSSISTGENRIEVTVNIVFEIK